MNTNAHEWFSGIQELLAFRRSGFGKCITKKWTKNGRKIDRLVHSDVKQAFANIAMVQMLSKTSE